MKASCIIPVYNAEKTLRRCVESIVYGEERDLEVILVDDCSKDTSWELCQKLSEEFSNVRSFCNPKNSGVSCTRNRGLQEAQGEYILFVDSDDWVSGKYVASFLHAAQRYPDRLVISGFNFYDFHTNAESLYVLDPTEPETSVAPRDYFCLVDSSLIQSPCNKIFRRDIIDQAKLCFDVTQSMGEDFQFALDYLRASKVRGCQVLNTGLYYYIRANDSSLMSKLGISGFENSKSRLVQLAQIGNVDDSVLQAHIDALKLNFLYHISRYSGYTKKEKLENIEKTMSDGKAGLYYRKQRRIQVFERMYEIKAKCSAVPKRVSGKLGRIRQRRMLKDIRKQVSNEGFSLISQNCIAGVFYHDLKMKFLSPTINLYFSAEDFTKFVSNLPHYLALDLNMSWGEKYPIGHLDDITIYFQHYSSCKEAKDAWDRRKDRINWNKILVLSTDREDFNSEIYQKWKRIPYPKILFTAQKQFVGGEGVLYFPQYEERGCVQDLISKREFYQDGVLIQSVNEI